MQGESSPSRLKQVVDLFVAHGVEFIVIGGQAESIFGSPRVTRDIDLCYRRTADNMRRLAGAAAALKVTLRGAPPGLPFRIDEKTFSFGNNFTFDTPLGPLDLLGYVEPLGEYDRLFERAETWALGEHELKVIALDDLIRVKQHIGRSKDRESLLQLLAIKRIREETGMR